MKVNQLKVGVLLSYTSMGLGYLVALAYTPIMLRLLGKSEYGLYNLVASVVAFLGVLNFGFGSTYTRFYLKNRAKNDISGIKALNGMFLIIFCLIGLIAMITSVVMALNVKLVFGDELTAQEYQTAKTLLLVLTANLAISFPGIVFSSHITANERFVFQNLINMLKMVFSPFISLPLLLLGYGSIGLAIATVSVSLLIEVSNIVYCIRKLQMRFSFRNFDAAVLRSVTSFSFYIFINLLIDQINWSVDKFIIGRYHGSKEVAVYGVAAQINAYYISISAAISNVFVPRVHALISGGKSNELNGLFVRIGRIQFSVLALLSLCLLFLGQTFFVLWAGLDYAESYLIAVTLVLPVTIPMIQSIGIEIQRAKNLHRFRSIVYFGVALLNVVITMFLAKQYRGIGAAVGTALAIVLGNGLIMNWYYQKKIGLDICHFWRQIGKMIPGIIPPVVLGIGINLLFHINRWIHLLSYGILFVVTYSFSMWKFGLNNYERNLLKSPVGKFLRRKG